MLNLRCDATSHDSVPLVAARKSLTYCKARHSRKRSVGRLRRTDSAATQSASILATLTKTLPGKPHSGIWQKPSRWVSRRLIRGYAAGIASLFTPFFFSGARFPLLPLPPVRAPKCESLPCRGATPLVSYGIRILMSKYNHIINLDNVLRCRRWS